MVQVELAYFHLRFIDCIGTEGSSVDLVSLSVLSHAVSADDESAHLRSQLIHLCIEVLPFEEA